MKDVMNLINYGLFILTARDKRMDNGCIICTAFQVSENPLRIAISVQKKNKTHDMIFEIGDFNLSILTKKSRFETYKHWGMQTGHEADKMDGILFERSSNGLIYVTEETNAFISCRVVEQINLESHTLFIGEVTEAEVFSKDPPVTYAYYKKRIKPHIAYAGKKVA